MWKGLMRIDMSLEIMIVEVAQEDFTISSCI